MNNGLIEGGFVKDFCKTLSENKVVTGMLIVAGLTIVGAVIDKNYHMNVGPFDISPYDRD